MSCLDKGQKARLAILARQAFDRLGAEDRASQTPDQYRRAQVAVACGKAGLRLCSQIDYRRVEGHFLNLINETGKALNALMRAETEERRQWYWKIIMRTKQYGITKEKADGICRQMTRGKYSLDDADLRTLRNVYFKLDYYKKDRTAESRRRGEKQGVMA